MRYWIANTDREWFQFLVSRAPREEVNFWAPNKVQPIKLPPGAPWLFKFHVRNGGWIVGGGFFAHYTTITPRFAWEAFREDNGAGTFSEMVRQLGRYSERPIDPRLLNRARPQAASRRHLRCSHLTVSRDALLPLATQA